MSALPSRRHPFKSSHFHDIFRAQPGPSFPSSDTPPENQTAESLTKKRSSRLPLFGRSRKKSTHSDIAPRPSGSQSGRASTTTRHERPSLQGRASTSQPSLLAVSAAQNTLGSKIVAHLTPRKSRKHKSEPSLSHSEDGVSDAPSVPPITTPAPSIRPSTDSTYSQSRTRQGGTSIPRNPPQPTITVSLPDSDDLSEYEDLFTKPRQKAKSKLAPLQIPPPSFPLRTARDRIRDSSASTTTTSSLTPSTSPNDTDPPDLVFANEGGPGTGHSSTTSTPTPETPETPTPTAPVDGFPPSSAEVGLEAVSATSADNTVTSPVTEKAPRNGTVTLTIEKSKIHQRPSPSSPSRTISKHPHPHPHPHPSSRVNMNGTQAPRPAISDTEFYAGYSTAEESDAMSVMSMPTLGGSGSFGRGRKANYQTSSNTRLSSSPTPSRARNVSLHAFGPSSKPPTIPLPPPPPNGARARPRANTILTLSSASTSTSSQLSTRPFTSVSASGNFPVTVTGVGLKRNNSASSKSLLSVLPNPPTPPPKDDTDVGTVAAHVGSVPASASVPSPPPEEQIANASANSGSSSNTSDVPNQTRSSQCSSGSSSRSGSSGSGSSGSSTQTLTLIPEIQPLDINLDTASADELRLALRQRNMQLANLAKYLRNVMEIHAQEKEGLEKRIADLERERDGMGAWARARSLGAPTPDLEKEKSDDSSVHSSSTRLPTPSPSIRLPIYRRLNIDELDSGGESYTSAGSGAEGSGTSGAESQSFAMASKPRRAMKKLRLVEHFYNVSASTHSSAYPSTYRPSSTSSFYSTSSSGSGSGSSPFSSPVSVTFPSALAGGGVGGSALSSIPEAHTPPSPTFPRPHTTSGGLSNSAKEKEKELRDKKERERERDRERERKGSASSKPSTVPSSITSTTPRLTPSEAYARNLRKDRPQSIAQVLGGSNANKQSSNPHQNQNQNNERIMPESFGGRSRVLLGLVPSKKSA
ncbi:hypothetical protein L218DRAFT_576933 [Marasmius fiardii PR-910]|nr:hypothetical protein L218DRAFT_576933 [Marasmius fiardii PR-910]